MFSWNSASLSTAASSGRPTGSSKLSPRNDTLYEGFPVKVAWWRLPGKSFLVEASRHRLLGKNFDPIVSVQSLSDLSPDSNLGVSTCIVTGVLDNVPVVTKRTDSCGFSVDSPSASTIWPIWISALIHDYVDTFPNWFSVRPSRWFQAIPCD